MQDRAHWIEALWSISLVLIVFGVFSGAFDNGFVNWDDGRYIVHNPLVAAPGEHSWRERVLTPELGYPVPLPVWVYGWLWTSIDQALLFHVVSVTVHAANVWMLGVLIRRGGARRGVAWIGALAFGLHPMVVEPVAWATGLKDLLLLAGALWALLLLPRRPVAAVAGVAVALLSKPSSVFLGFALAAFVWRRGAGRVQWLAVGVATIAGVTWGGIAAWTEPAHLRTTGGQGLSLFRVAGALGVQAQHVVVPASLAARYPDTALRPIDAVVGAMVAGAVAWALWSWHTEKSQRFAWTVFGVALYLPVSNLYPLRRFTADSYAYGPWASLVVVTCIAFVRHEERIRRISWRLGSALRWLPRFVIVAWALLTHLQVETWRSTSTLWAWAAQRYPDDGESIYRYGDALSREGDARGALELYLSHLPALEASPRIPGGLIRWYEHQGDWERVAVWYRRAFSSAVRQTDDVYAGYLRYLALDPLRHRAEEDAVLWYAWSRYLDGTLSVALSQTQRRALERVWAESLARDAVKTSPPTDARTRGSRDGTRVEVPR
ncbi:MAG: hypothetical protein V3V08_17930 [Nannocystaceae bacterium]